MTPAHMLERLEGRSAALIRASGAGHVASCADSPARRHFLSGGGPRLRVSPWLFLRHFLRVGRLGRRAVAGVRESARALKEELGSGRALAPARRAGPEFLAGLEARARSLGVSAVGYASVPSGLVFQDMAVLHQGAVVLLMEMGFEAIDRAPGPAAGREVFRTYAALGEAANALAAHLVRHGFSAQASHPLGGAVLYPALAERAGLGVQGRNGLLLNPDYGPRHRLAAVFTNVADLPVPQPVAGAGEAGVCEAGRAAAGLEWLESLCQSCGACVAACPTGALRGTPLERPGGLRSYLDFERCVPFFMAHTGCSLCLKVCPLSRPGYGRAVEHRLTGAGAGDGGGSVTGQ